VGAALVATAVSEASASEPPPEGPPIISDAGPEEEEDEPTIGTLRLTQRANETVRITRAVGSSLIKFEKDAAGTLVLGADVAAPEAAETAVALSADFQPLQANGELNIAAIRTALSLIRTKKVALSLVRPGKPQPTSTVHLMTSSALQNVLGFTNKGKPTVTMKIEVPEDLPADGKGGDTGPRSGPPVVKSYERVTSAYARRVEELEKMKAEKPEAVTRRSSATGRSPPPTQTRRASQEAKPTHTQRTSHDMSMYLAGADEVGFLIGERLAGAVHTLPPKARPIVDRRSRCTPNDLVRHTRAVPSLTGGNTCRWWRRATTLWRAPS
jgi:hypothetical protein